MSYVTKKPKEDIAITKHFRTEIISDCCMNNHKTDWSNI